MDFLRMKLILPICFFLYTHSSYAQPQADFLNLTRIVGGELDNIAKYPYLVQILKNGDLYCGGSLITKSHVVTAAHCMAGVSANQLKVVGGSSTLSKASGINRGVEKITIPASYKEVGMGMDVAVIKLSSPMTGPNVSTIPLCNSRLRPTQKVQLVGWGRTSENALKVSHHLRSTQVSVLSRRRCSSYRELRGLLTNTMFCAYASGRDSCQGDSGGPVIKNGQLCGIVSFGYGCARRSPGVYTNINKVKPFIQEAVSH